MCCVGAVSDQCAKFDDTLGAESGAMPPVGYLPGHCAVVCLVQCGAHVFSGYPCSVLSILLESFVR